MASLTTIHDAPLPENYTSLTEYQSQTPETFFDGKPVLHLHVTGVKLWLPQEQRELLPVGPTESTVAPSGLECSALGEDAANYAEHIVDVFVASDYLTLFNPTANVGVHIPYPSISIHALRTLGSGASQLSSLWLQVELPGSGGARETEDEIMVLNVTLVPSLSSSEPSEEQEPTTSESNTDAPLPITQQLYNAISDCSDLHPDPENDEEDEDAAYDNWDRIVFEANDELENVAGYEGVWHVAGGDGLPPPVPGSSGWITAENMHEFVDADGNWIGGAGGESLGDGAGRVRAHDEVDKADTSGAGDKKEEGESKKPRMDGS